MKRRDFTRTLLGLPLAAAIPPAAYAAAAADGITMPPGGSIADVPGLKVGHHTRTDRPTGCTVMLCEAGATAGVDVRGSAPGTRETDLLSPSTPSRKSTPSSSPVVPPTASTPPAESCVTWKSRTPDSKSAS